MQQKRNMPGRFLRETPEEVWEHIEDEFGALNQPARRNGKPRLGMIDDAELKQRLTTELRFAEWRGDTTLRVPREVAERVIGAVLEKCRGGEPAALKRADTALRRFSKQTRAAKGRAAHAPRKNWLAQLLQDEACDRLLERQRELMADKTKNYSHPNYDALHQAANEIAPQYAVSADTLISWLANPGDRSGRRRQARRRKRQARQRK